MRKGAAVANRKGRRRHPVAETRLRYELMQRGRKDLLDEADAGRITLAQAAELIRFAEPSCPNKG
jgi:hypothetical protein